MKLVERFVEIGYWPTSRKTVLWSGVLLALHGVAWLGVWASESSAGGAPADRALVHVIIGTWSVALAASMALALLPALRGEDARWTAYAFTLLYSSPVVPLLYVLDDGAVLTYMPIIALFATVFFDEHFGAIALLYMVLAWVASMALSAFGALPNGARFLAHFSPRAAELALHSALLLLAQTFILMTMLCVLMVSARRVQERRLAEARDAIRRYVPAQIADAILAGRHEPDSKHERRKLTIFFSDIVGFTALSEELEPEDLSRVLNEYFAEMMKIAHRHGGTVDELSGDAILVLFGAPHATDDRDHALRAVRMALEMQAAMAGLNARWRAAGITESLSVRMGVNTGVVTIGNFGSPDRMKYAALGKHVNLAARIQQHCQPGRVLISQSTWLLVQEQVRCAPAGEVQFKGIQKPVMTYHAEPA